MVHVENDHQLTLEPVHAAGDARQSRVEIDRIGFARVVAELHDLADRIDQQPVGLALELDAHRHRRPVVAARQSLVALLGSAADRARLGGLVAWDANWPLDRPDPEASAAWLQTVIDLIDACQANPDLQAPTARKRESATIEGRIFGEPPWSRRVNYSYRWQSNDELNDVVNDAIRARWADVKLHLAFNGIFEETFDAGRTVGQGFVNANADSGGPPRSLLTPTNHVRLILAVAPPPAGFHIVVAMPCVVGKGG